MIEKRVIADPATHYGSGKGATRLFKLQRLTAVFNILFMIFFVWLVVRLAGADRAEMVAVIGNPFVGSALALLVINVCVHMRIGVREIIEDYLDEEHTNRLAVLGNDIFSGVVGVVAILAILKIVIWG